MRLCYSDSDVEGSIVEKCHVEEAGAIAAEVEEEVGRSRGWSWQSIEGKMQTVQSS